MTDIHTEENYIIDFKKPLFEDKNNIIHSYYIKNNKYIYTGLCKYTYYPCSYTIECKWNFTMLNEYYNRQTDLYHYKDDKNNDIRIYDIESEKIKKLYKEYYKISNEIRLMKKEDVIHLECDFCKNWYNKYCKCNYIKFGKYKGLSFDEFKDKEYLLWCYKQYKEKSKNNDLIEFVKYFIQKANNII